MEWGAQAIYNLSPAFQVATGVFNTNQSSALGGKGGVNFALQQGNRGVLTLVQLSYFLNHAPDDKGVPGQYSFGGFYNGNRFANLNNPNSTKSGLYSIYGMFQQMIYSDGEAGSQKGLTIWGETAIAPRSIVSFMPYFIGGGLSYQGAIPRRDDDIASAGVIFSGTLSRYVPQTTAETVIEVNYQITFNRWLSITPDIQYVIKPSGSSAIKNALVLGTQVAIVFRRSKFLLGRRRILLHSVEGFAKAGDGTKMDFFIGGSAKVRQRTDQPVCRLRRISLRLKRR